MTAAALFLLSAGLLVFSKDKPGEQGKTPTKPIKFTFIDAYQRWMDSEVAYIITDEERAAFKKLATAEEREQFIEQFWERRNPNPGSIENKFKNLYYNRIVFANQRFSCGIPGWKMDRGRIYIQYGPPDDIESSASGGNTLLPYVRGKKEFGEFLREEWRYSFIGGLGRNVILKFVDPAGTGEYRRVLDAGEQDPLLRISIPQIGIVEPADVDALAAREEQYRDESIRVDDYTIGRALPAAKLRDLRAFVTEKLQPVRVLPLSFRTYDVPATEETDFEVLAFSLPLRRLQFTRQEGRFRAELQVYGRVAVLGGRIVQEFGKVLDVNVPEGDFPEYVGRSLTFPEPVPLRPGRYKIDVAVRDSNNGQIGALQQQFQVPRFDPDMLANSSLILADKIGSWQSTIPDPQLFRLGGNMPGFNPAQAFSRDQGLGFYLEIYGLGLDPVDHKSSLTFEYRVLREGKAILSQTEEVREPSIVHIVQKKLHLNLLTAGAYTLELRVTDRVRNQTISPSTTFDVI